jgi:hypothetical protein
LNAATASGNIAVMSRAATWGGSGSNGWIITTSDPKCSAKVFTRPEIAAQRSEKKYSGDAQHIPFLAF